MRSSVDMSDRSQLNYSQQLSLDNARNIMQGIFDLTITMTSPRMITLKNKPLGILNRLLQIGILLFVLISMLMEYTYLTLEPTVAVVAGHVESGTMNTGKGQGIPGSSSITATADLDMAN